MTFRVEQSYRARLELMDDVPLKNWQPPPRWSWRDDLTLKLVGLAPGSTVTVLVPTGLCIQERANDLDLDVIITRIGKLDGSPYQKCQVTRSHLPW